MPRSNCRVRAELPRAGLSTGLQEPLAPAAAARHSRRMDDRLAAVFAAQGGVASSTDAARLGIRAVQLDNLVRSHELVRVRRGAYALKEVYDSADVWERYRLRTKA